MQFTLGSMYWVNPRYTDEEFRADVRRVRENRLTLLRTFIPWEHVELEPGRFDFAAFDRFFRAAEAENIAVMPTLIFYPPFFQIQAWLDQGIDDRGRRVPCLDRPEVRDMLFKYIEKVVTRYRNSPALALWNLWNEPTDPICRCADSLRGFAAWLKKRYPDDRSLHAAWEDESYVFKTIFPPDRDKLNEQWLKNVLESSSRARITGLQLDWSAFQRENSAGHMAFLADSVRRFDSVHPVHSNPAQTAANFSFSGVSPWHLSDVLDSISGSVHPHNFFSGWERDPREYPRAMLGVIDRIRSWGGAKAAFIGEYQAGSTTLKTDAYTPDRNDIRATLYHALARGLSGVIYWEWQSWRQSFFEVGEFSLRNPSDGGPTERSAATAEVGRFLEDNSQCLQELAPVQPDVAILESAEQNDWDFWMESNGMRGFGALHTQACAVCHRALSRVGIPADFLCTTHLEPALLQRYKAIYLPHIRTMDARTAALLADYTAQGGALWADGRCAMLDHHLFLRGVVPGNGLDRVFGCREADEIAPRADTLLELADGRRLKPWREVQRLHAEAGTEVLAVCGGYPAAVRHAFGRGTAELWGTWLTAGAARREIDAPDRLIADFAYAQGIASPLEVEGTDDLLMSVRCTKGNMLAVLTNSAVAERSVRIHLPASCSHCRTEDGKTLAVSSGLATLSIPAGGTAVLIFEP